MRTTVYNINEQREYLKAKDPILKKFIDSCEPFEINTNEDIFQNIINHIIGQQISNAAQKTIFEKLTKLTGQITPSRLCDTGINAIQRCGVSLKKAQYIYDFAAKVKTKQFDLNALSDMSDDEAVFALTSIKGIGEWTAEMILIGSLNRPDVLSYGDLALKRGIKKLYGYPNIDEQLFAMLKKRYTPCCSLASMYLWKASDKSFENYYTDFDKWNAVNNKQNIQYADFLYGVKTTKIYCRPTCSSKIPKRENIVFFTDSADAEKQGFRPCKRCMPQLEYYDPAVRTAEEIRLYINEHFRLSGLVADTACKTNLSVSALNRSFKNVFLISANEYIKILRIHEAKKLINRTKKNIADIAFEIGYESLSSFYRDFKRLEGKAPLKCKK